jgi:hypothetical protein
MLQGARGQLKPYKGGEEETDSPEDAGNVGIFESAKLEALVVLLKQIPGHEKSLVFSSFVKCVDTCLAGPVNHYRAGSSKSWSND